MALRLVERAVLSQGAQAEGSARILRDAIPHHRAQWRVLSHADAGSRQRVARADAAGVRVCLEGLEVHHALEAAVGALRQQSRVAGRPAAAPAAKSGADTVSTAASV